jgi:hypothetical protein
MVQKPFNRRGSTTEQLRHDIDSGLTGEKNDWPDPAAVPLGTDEEAAGTPLDPLLIHEVRRQERRRSSAKAPDHSWLILVAAGAVIALAVTLASLFLRQG